jgi:hypothetical protein
MKYYVKLGNKHFGPISAQDIRGLLEEGSCKLSDAFGLDRQKNRISLESIKAVTDALESSVPIKNPLAWLSLFFAVAAIAAAFVTANPFPFWGVCAFVCFAAIICGHFASWKIRQSFNAVDGELSIKTGLFIGYPMLFFSCLAGPVFCAISEAGERTRAINNCRQIVVCLKIHASDGSGSYIDERTRKITNSNDAFHVLFTKGIISDERVFGSSYSPFQPDGYIGEEPDYIEALKPGENHWAMTKGLSDSSPSNMPLVFENPSESTWPPKWNAESEPRSKPGRAWPGGKVIVGMNDGTVHAHKLTAPIGTNLELAPDAEGKPIFPPTPKYEILNVAK